MTKFRLLMTIKLHFDEFYGEATLYCFVKGYIIIIVKHQKRLWLVYASIYVYAATNDRIFHIILL